GPHLLRSVSAVHGAGLNKHGGTHVVSAVNIGGQLVEQIPLVGNTLGAHVPEVVMGIADGQLRLQGRFRGQCEPVIISKWHNGTSVIVYGGAIIAHRRPLTRPGWPMAHWWFLP